MTADQRAVLAVREAGGYTDEVPVIAEAIRAAIRERDAAHEIALKKARADALDAAAALFEAKAAQCHPTYSPDRLEADTLLTYADEIRALLEEAGK